MTETIPAEVAAFLARMPAEARQALAASLAQIDAKLAKRAAMEARRAKASATAAEIDAQASVPELAGEPDIEVPCESRIERLLEGGKAAPPPHAEREKVRRRNAEREATRRQLQADSQALAELAVKLGREIEDLDEAIKRKRQAFYRDLIGPLVAVARREMVAYIRGTVQIAEGLADTMRRAGIGVPGTLDDVTRIEIAFWRGDGTNNRDKLWPGSWNGREVYYRAEVHPFDPPAALAALETALRADAAPTSDA